MSKANAVQSYLRNNNFWLFGLFFFFYFFIMGSQSGSSLSIILCNCHRIKGDRSGGHRTR
ncbi:MFS transporter [Yersinia pestis]|uniref:MFS transporter n=1 Tax=Yersinia pestis TaxID=632 RepID=UPI00402BAEDD